MARQSCGACSTRPYCTSAAEGRRMRRPYEGLYALTQADESGQGSLSLGVSARSLPREITEPLEVALLLVGARGQLEQPGRGPAEDVVLGLLREEGQIPDPARQLEVPVRIVGRVEQLRLSE